MSVDFKIVFMASLFSCLSPRTMKGLEDLGIGYCHSYGMGFNGTNISTTTFLGAFKRDGNGSTTVSINWTKLVQRPECVDVLSITSENETLLELRDPFDVSIYSNYVDIEINVCERGFYKMTFQNTRGGYNVRIADVNIIRQMTDEEFSFDFMLDSPLRKVANISRYNKDLLSFVNDHDVTINWRRSLHKDPLVLDCIDKVDVLSERVDTDRLISSSLDPVSFHQENCWEEINFHLDFIYQDIVYFSESVRLNQNFVQRVQCDFTKMSITGRRIFVAILSFFVILALIFSIVFAFSVR